MNTSKNTLVVPAIQFEQRGHRIFTTVFRAADLVNNTKVDYYNSNVSPTDPNQGYQRPPERSRITRIGSYLIKTLGGGLYPTAVLLAARKPLQFDPVKSNLILNPQNPFQVIDGQHRIAGLKYAIEEKENQEIANLQVPAIILEVSDRIVEMEQFRIINGTAKSVRTDLVNAILTAKAAQQGDEVITTSERWKVVVTQVVDYLDRADESPWKGVLVMPDELGVSKAGAEGSDAKKIVRATSMMTSLRPVYEWLSQTRFLQGKSIKEEVSFVGGIMFAYWSALQEVVPDAFSDPRNYVIQKTPGLFSLHLLLRDKLLPDMFRGRREWTKENFILFLKDSPEITEPMFWNAKEDRASKYGSMKGFRDLADLLIDSVQPVA